MTRERVSGGELVKFSLGPGARGEQGEGVRGDRRTRKCEECRREVCVGGIFLGGGGRKEGGAGGRRGDSLPSWERSRSDGKDRSHPIVAVR